jgi:hypothetical protein
MLYGKMENTEKKQKTQSQSLQALNRSLSRRACHKRQIGPIRSGSVAAPAYAQSEIGN